MGPEILTVVVHIDDLLRRKLFGGVGGQIVVSIVEDRRDGEARDRAPGFQSGVTRSYIDDICAAAPELATPTPMLGPSISIVGSRRTERTDDPRFNLLKRRVQIRLLNRAGVSNGDKAIAIWLSQNWGPELVDRWGPHSNPHSIKRWRTEAARRATAQAGPQSA